MAATSESLGALGTNEEDRVAQLISQGWTLLQEGHATDAINAFGRVLLRDPTHREAQRGLQEARRLASELERVSDARLDEAALALDAGDLDRARALIEDVVERGGDRDRARSLLDRADPRAGRLTDVESLIPPASAHEEMENDRRRGTSWRAVLGGVWVVVLAGSMVGLALSWEPLVSRLTRPPSPHNEVTSSLIPGTPLSRGEQVMEDARRRLEAGDPAGAMAVLAQVAPEEPVYPLAVKLRHEAETALKGGGRTR